jgi:hypothetical protein
MAPQPARATGSECWVHERAIARVVFARAGIVDAAEGVLRWDGAVRADEVESEVWKGRLTRCFRERPDWLLRLRRGGSFPGVTASP